MEWAPQFLNEVLPQIPVLGAIVLAAAWLVGCVPGRGRTLVLSGLGVSFVVTLAGTFVKCVFWLGVMHGVADTGGNLWIVLIEPVQALVDALVLMLVSVGLALASRGR